MADVSFPLNNTRCFEAHGKCPQALKPGSRTPSEQASQLLHLGSQLKRLRRGVRCVVENIRAGGEDGRMKRTRAATRKSKAGSSY
jgi:hypothetical protein